uniref:Uncharacterized protein n=1 Tax=Mucochytrium quahogii TaxID=96639 RepID=A0A7S2SAA1_9STRA
MLNSMGATEIFESMRKPNAVQVLYPNRVQYKSVNNLSMSKRSRIVNCSAIGSFRNVRAEQRILELEQLHCTRSKSPNEIPCCTTLLVPSLGLNFRVLVRRGTLVCPIPIPMSTHGTLGLD